MPKVTVCIPVYNVESYIERCIKSTIAQSLRDIEIIIINDDTPDNSMSIVRRFASIDNRIKIINHPKNMGSMITRQSGYLAATGDFITFLDGDDTLEIDSLKTLYSAAINENADIVSGTIRYLTNKGEEHLWTNVLRYGSNTESVFKSLLRQEFCHNLCSKLFRRELLQNYSYLNYEGMKNGEDAMLFYQIVNNAQKSIAIDKISYNYYQNLASSSQNANNIPALSSMIKALCFQMRIVKQYDFLYFDSMVYLYNVLSSICSCGNKLSSVKQILSNNDFSVSFNPFVIIRYCGVRSISILFHLYLSK